MPNTLQSTLTDQTIATDMLFTAKSSIKHLALAITESASPQVRSFLKQEFDIALSFHEKIFGFLQTKGWYDPFDLKKQIQNDISNANNALNL